MNSGIFDHVAFATTKTDASIEIFAILGFDRMLFYKKNISKFESLITKLTSLKGQIIEIVEPSSEKSVVHRLLKSYQGTVYHTAFLVNDIEKTIVQLKELGTIVITEPMSIPYPTSEKHYHYMTSHLFHPNIGLFEVTGNVI